MVLYTIALVIHAIICIALVLVILAQTSQGGLDANLSGAAVNVFGGSGASKMLKKWTQILALIFAISCVLLALKVKSVSDGAYRDMQKRQDKIQHEESEASASAAQDLPVTAEEASKTIDVEKSD